MRYLYKCEDCHIKPITVEKPMKDSSKLEQCECGKIMTRIYSVPRITTGDGTKSA